ncbi:hypothetical protein SAMN05421749_105145 [Acinetobacter marinus]|uniref:UPF0260 protein SAMN05421749_105145 n=1 Tax=Acinetobacter marinus TaxID=281375 RepID=A0A1G6LQD1_9GAMM|nr:YcgN family cysteine cluster protein [Acinetobacter marinus]SDC45498.1 hypothetical protein SAMN05421749_105145 [Acinetobacter marinus]
MTEQHAQDDADRTPALRPEFWRLYALEQLNRTEWEALCDGCGQCCLIKLEDEDSGEVVYTNVACKLLDCSTGACSDYPHRQQFVPDCIQLSPALLSQIKWLPSTCGYRRVHEGKDLPRWHHLISGDRSSVIRAKKSVANRCVSENAVAEEDIEAHVIRWVR